MKGFIFIIGMLMSAVVSISAQFSISISGSLVLVDDFNSFTGSGFSAIPGAGQLNSNIWSANGFSDGNLAFGGEGISGDFARGTSTGGVSTGGVYAFNIGGGDVVLGVQPIGADFTPGDFRLALKNDTGAVITSLSVQYNIPVFNDQNRSSVLSFAHGLDNSTYTTVSSLNLTTQEAEDDPASWATVSRGTTVTGLSIGDGASYYLQWYSDDVAGSGSRDQFGIDDVMVGANVIPEPSTYALIFGGLALGIVFIRRRLGLKT